MQPQDLQRIRQQLGWTQSMLAERLGLTSEFISMMERGKKAIEKRTELAVYQLYDRTPRTGAEGGPNSLIERVACAIYGQRVGNPNYWGAVTQAEIEEARAALRALREPTDAMKEAGAFTSLETSYGGDDNSFEYLSEDGAAEVWQKMIDKALEA